MYRKICIISLIATFMSGNAMAQTTHTPSSETKQVVWGLGFGVNSFTRLPADAQQTIPADVWRNSRCSSGLQIRFRTNAASVVVDYGIEAKSTSNNWFSDVGANGLDMYARKSDGKWYWCHPTTRTVGEKFSYTQLDPDDATYHNNGYEYRLYLPPFAVLTSLSITVNAGASFEYIPVPQDKKPIVIYGTSIVHGAVCSRPGNTWTNIVSRNIPDRPIVNLGFSGTGRVEPEVVKVINEIDAEIFVLDCLPNMSNAKLIPFIESRYLSAIDTLRKYHPHTPILLAEHIGYADMGTNKTRKQWVLDANSKLKNVYAILKKKGYKGIYYITRGELGLDMSADIGDYIHPNDKGMYQYAKAYTQKLKKISGRLGH